MITDIRRLDDPADCSLLYVGCTRALHRLVILAHESLSHASSRRPSPRSRSGCH